MVRRDRIPYYAQAAAAAPAAPVNGNGNGNGAAAEKNVINAGNMLGRPTVAVSERADARVIQSIQTDPYFSIKVSTVGATQPEKVILFDGSKGYQFGYNDFNGANVAIEGLSAHYQFILNDLVHNASYQTGETYFSFSLNRIAEPVPTPIIVRMASSGRVSTKRTRCSGTWNIKPLVGLGPVGTKIVI